MEGDWVIKVKIRSDFEVNLFGSGVSEIKLIERRRGGDLTSKPPWHGGWVVWKRTTNSSGLGLRKVKINSGKWSQYHTTKLDRKLCKTIFKIFNRAIGEKGE